MDKILLDLLINACVMYDKTKKANIGKRRNIYNTNIDSTYVDYPTDVIDYVPDSSHGGIDLPPDEFYQILDLSFSHPPSPRPDTPPDHLSGPNLGSKSPSKSMMALSTCHLKSINY